MNCVLTKEQHLQFFKKIVSDLFEINKTNKPVDIKEYIKDIHTKIIEKTNDKDLALAYVSIIPTYMQTAIGLNTKTIGRIALKGKADELNKLEEFFDKDIENVINYVTEVSVSLELVKKVMDSNPTTGTNIPALKGDDLIKVIKDNNNSAIPASMLSTTGQDSEVVDGKYTNILKPNMARTLLVRNTLLSQMNLSATDLGSELTYSFHKGFKLRVLNEKQLPSNIAPLGRERNENYLVVAITDNEGNFLAFDKDGKINKDGEVIHFTFRKPNQNTIDNHNKYIQDTLNRLRKSLESSGIAEVDVLARLDAAKKELDTIKNNEIIIANEILEAYKENPESKLLLDIIGGSKGYIEEALGRPWTKVSDINVSDEELRTIHAASSGITEITLDGLSKDVEIQALPLNNKNIENIVNDIAKVLSTPISTSLTGQNKIDYLNVFLNLKSNSKDNSKVSLQLVDNKLLFEINGKNIDLTSFDAVKDALLTNGLYYNIKLNNIKNTTYQDIVITDDGKILRKDKLYTDFLKNVTVLDAIPNAENKIVELNGYFNYSYIKPETKEDVQKNIDDSKKLNTLEDEDWENVPLETNKLIELATTPEQQKKADNWWKTSPLSTLKVNGELVVPLEVLKNIVNSNAFANWSVAGIKLFNGSDDTHLYHEAWHAFSQLFLTREDKNKLYGAVSKLPGTFKVVVRAIGENGNIVPMLQDVEFSKATKRQLEEYIAEEFRNYAINKGDYKAPAKGLKSIFEKILKFLKSLFTGVTIQDSTGDVKLIKPLADMFEALYVGNINNYAPSVNNVSFSILNAGILSISDINEARTYADSKKIKDSIDGIISQLIYERSKVNPNWTVRGLTVNSNKINIYKEVKKRILKRYVELLKLKQDAKQTLTPEETLALEGNMNLIKGPITKVPTATEDDIQVLNSNLDLLNWTYTNFGDIEQSVNEASKKEKVAGVVSYHLINSEFKDLLKKSVPEDKDIDDVNASSIVKNDSGYGENKVNAINSFEDADNQVIYLVKSLLKQNKQGETELNSLGFPVLADYVISKNNMERKLTGVPTISGLYNKMDELSKFDNIYEQLKLRLGKPGEGNKEQDKLWIKFLRTFSRPKQSLYAHNVESEVTKDNNNAIIDTKITIKIGVAQADVSKIRSLWQSEFNTNSPKENPYVLQTPDNENYLNLPKIVKDFLVEDSKVYKGKTYVNYNVRGGKDNTILFLRALGIYVTPVDTTLNDISNPDIIKAIKFLATSVGKLNNKSLNGGGEVLIKNPIETFSKDGKGFEKIIDENNKVTYKEVTVDNQNSLINKLLKIEGANSDKYSSTSKLNSEGEIQNEIAKQSTSSKRVYALQNASNINDFANENSWYSFMSYLDKRNNPYAKSSVILNSLYNTINGKRTGTRIELINLSGTSYLEYLGISADEEGLSHSSMGIDDKFISDFNMLLLAGVVQHPTTGGKSTHYATKVSNIKTYDTKKQSYLYIDSADFIADFNNNYAGFDRAFDIILPKIQSELERILKFNANREIYDNYKGFSEKTTGTFSIFDDILNEATKNKLQSKFITDELKKVLYPVNATDEQLAVYQNNKDITLFNILNNSEEGLKLKEQIKTELKYYFEQLYTETKETLMDKYGYVAAQIRTGIVANMRGEKLDIREPENIEKIDNAALRSFIYNNWINNSEITVLHNGDISVYDHNKDEATKRYPLVQSSGDMFVTDEIGCAMVNKLGTPYTKQFNSKKEDVIYNGKLNTAVIKDNTTKRDSVYKELHDLFKKDKEKKGFTGEELAFELYGRNAKTGKLGTYDKPEGGAMKAYDDMKITDGQGYITFDTYRQLKYAEGKWDDDQEALYQKIINKEKIEIGDVAQFFPVYKLQMAGNLKTEPGLLPVTSAHKFALFPLIPSVIEGGPLEELHIAMMEQDTHYVTYGSGSKLASITNNANKKDDNVFNEQTGHFIEGTKFTPNVIYVDYLKNQVDINSEFKGVSMMSTQLRTLLSTGLMEKGIPVDFKNELSEQERLTEWESMDEDKKESESEFYKLIRNYEKRVNRLVDLKKEDLISKLPGWYKKGDNYYGPVLSVVDFIKKELKEQGLTEHELSFIEVGKIKDKDGKDKIGLLRDLSASPIADTIEKSLLSLIDRKIRKQMVNGEPLVEVSVSSTLKFKNIDSAIEKYGNADLKFYYADGTNQTKACQVKIALQGNFLNLFNLNDTKGNKIGQYDSVEVTNEDGTKSIKKVLNLENSRLRLNELIKDEEWLNQDDNRKKIRLTGVRIPVQGLNSMEFAEIAEFLPEEVGNIIILPAEIVAKSGTDFDVDKLTTYLPTISKSGKWLSDDYASREELNNEIAETEKKLKDLLFEKLGKDDDVKTLIKEYRSDKKDKALSILALKTKRDILKNEISSGIEDIKIHIKNIDAEDKVTGGLEQLMISDNDGKSLNIITAFINKPRILSKGEVSKTFDTILKNSKELNEIKAELKDSYEDQTDYLKEYPEINALNDKYQELKDQKRNFIRAIENSLINDIISILELPENAVRLLTANDTHKAKPYADEMESYVQDFNFKKSKKQDGVTREKGVSATRLMEYPYLLKKHEDNFVSKEALGIAALGNKGNSVYNSAGAYIPSTIPIKVRVGQKEITTEVSSKIYLNTNKMFAIEDGKQVSVISLSNLYDKLNENEISEIISQLMNGYVDSEKDAWVAYIQGNKEVTPIILFLLETGVPFKDIVYYVSNPIIREYIAKSKLNNGVLSKLRNPTNNRQFAKSNAKSYVWNRVLGRSGDVPNLANITDLLASEYGDKIFNTTELESIAKSSLEDATKNKDARAGFLQYLFIEELAKNFNEPRNKTNLDTTKSANLYDVYSRQTQIDELYESTRMPKKIIQYIVETGPTASFRLTEIAQDLFGPLFPLRNNPIINDYLYKIQTDYKKINLVKKETGIFKDAFPAKFKNAITNYLFVNNLKSFNLGESSHYMGTPVKYVTTGTKSVEVKDGVVHINENLLKREFKNKLFLKETKGKNSYNEKGLSPVDINAFYTRELIPNKLIGAKSYYDFVISREHLRFLKPFEKFTKTFNFKSKLEKIYSENFYKPKANESAEDFKLRMSKMIYEEYLRNSALENSYNVNTMFFNNKQSGIASYATTLMSIIRKYPNLEEKYSIIQQLSASPYSEGVEKTKNLSTNFAKDLVNISLKDSNALTPESTEQYAIDLEALADVGVNKINIDSDEAREDNERLSDLFKKFPIYVFLQGGMNKNQFAFPSIFPANSEYSKIMNDAVNKISDNIDENLLDVVFDLFIKNNRKNTKKLNQRKGSINYLSATPLSQLKSLNDNIKKIELLTKNREFDKITSTSIDGIYTLDNQNITPEERDLLGFLYVGQARFVSEDNTNPDTSLLFKYGSKEEIDESIQSMIESLGNGIALIFNETGYGQGLDKELQNYLSEQLFDKIGITNTPSPVIKVAGNKIINNDDIASFNQYLSKSNGVLPKEFFTSSTRFKEFYNSQTGKKETAPQSSKWILNQEGYYDLIDKEEGEIYITNVNLSTGVQMVNKVSQPQVVTTTINNASEYTNHSGGAYGGDTFWDIIGREFGVTKHMHYKDAGNANLSQKLRNAGVKATVLTKEQMDTARAEVERLLGKKYPDTTEGNLQVRNYYQVANADSIFAIAQLADENGKVIKSYLYPTIKGVTGGTNTAIQLAIKLNKPVYVWDLGLKTWFKWNGKHFEATETPTLTKNFAGIGSRDIESYNVQKDGKWVPRAQYKGKEIEEAAKEAIRDVYENTFKSTTQPSTSIKPTIDLNREWKGDLESRPVYTKEGVNTMRTTSAKPNEHFGNPFSEAGYGNTIKVDSIADAVLAYKDWLLNGVTLVKTTNKVNLDTYLKPFEAQRTWILNQINQGKLDSATLLYAGKSAARGQGMHPTALAEVVEQLRSKPTQPSTDQTVKKIPNSFNIGNISYSRNTDDNFKTFYYVAAPFDQTKKWEVIKKEYAITKEEYEKSYIDSLEVSRKEKEQQNEKEAKRLKEIESWNNENNIVGKTFPFNVGENEKGMAYEHTITIKKVRILPDGNWNIIGTNNVNGNTYDMITEPNGNVISYTRDGKIFKGYTTDEIVFAYDDYVKPITDTQPSTSVQREYTPEKLTKENMPTNGVFVFGSNDRGVHGLGAAKTAVTEFGAKTGQASGQQGNAFAIRTKMYQDGKLLKYNQLTEENKKLMDKMTIEDLNNLRIEAMSNPDKKYYVTEIGTKLAGRTVEQMKDFFIRMNNKFSIPNNIILPQIFEIREVNSNLANDHPFNNNLC